MLLSIAWGIEMNLKRITGLFALTIALASALALSACSGGGPPTTASAAVAPTSSANAYTGPAPATADVQAFAVSFWNNIRVQNRCGQCHNATSPAQMPNFAHRRQGQRRPQLLAVRPERLRSDSHHLDLQLGRSHGHREHPSAVGGPAGPNRRPEP